MRKIQDIGLRTKLALLIVSFVSSLYLLEFGLSFLPSLVSERSAIAMTIAEKRGLTIDKRKRWEALRDLRSSGENWYPSVSSTTFMYGKNLTIAGQPVIPFGSVAETNILYCNESGFFVTYESDEFGFRNPRGIWRSQEPLDTVFVGDSFTNGSCVKNGDGFVDRIRESFPRTINMGATGNGPISQLAVIREYLPDRRVRHVFWVYFEGNDLADLHNKEVKEPVLVRYVDDENYSQKLSIRVKSINEQIISYANAEFEAAKKELPAQDGGIVNNLLFGNIKEALFRLKNSIIGPQPAQYDLVLLQTVISKAAAEVNRRGGKLVFVYLPEFARYDGNKTQKSSGAHLKKDVIEMVNSVGIDVIDIDLAFSKLDDARTVFPFSLHGHYNAGGNMIVAGEILRYLNQSARHQAR